MTLFNKIKWILGIAVVFLLVITTNLVDRQNFMIIEASIETIYADRIIAQDIIYDISNEVAQIEVDYAKSGSDQLNVNLSSNNDSIEEYIRLFAATKLTAKEKMFFDRLKESLKDLKSTAASAAADEESAEKMKANLMTVREQLDELADIQVQEGKRELYESKKALGSAYLFTQLEIAALIIMAVIVQIIILYAPKIDPDA
ncbi:chemotaxis protein [Neolewinella aurantiaca]|uniref:Chemotaxis protein n=1 Tax=Neolewinella aurantiaca TaxID=2602767 RepID=A0A5C7FKP2_9BACT|nr:MCP four helix bundle domain-containing protein [Neolewinella aurantiaca]TXF87903.1 chemotaxis protein [Neolewinella aurantiaca]